MKNLFSCIAALTLTFATAQADIIFEDGFESTTFETTNSDGFAWDNPNRTSIVNAEGVVNNGRPISNPIEGSSWYEGRNFDPRPAENAADETGEYSMRFRYAANNEWTEQRFDLGGAYKDLWVSYWIRVPTNYSRGLTKTGGGTNNKWFVMWMGRSKTKFSSDYTNNAISRFGVNTRPGIMAGDASIEMSLRDGTGGSSATVGYSNFITRADAGRWMHLVYQLKASTNTKDGTIRTHRRWYGEQEYTLIAEMNNISVGVGAGSIAAGREGWGAGYILGYANMPYANDTEWLLDDFTTANHSLLSVNASSMFSPPRPPTSLGASVK